MHAFVYATLYRGVSCKIHPLGGASGSVGGGRWFLIQNSGAWLPWTPSNSATAGSCGAVRLLVPTVWLCPGGSEGHLAGGFRPLRLGVLTDHKGGSRWTCSVVGCPGKGGVLPWGNEEHGHIRSRANPPE